MGTVRAAAVANENRQIAESQSRAIAAREAEKKPRTALEAMAARLQVSPQTLQNTLRNTVFAACRTNEEFVALVIVANTYGLNPLLKEIYAFPTKGGGIQAMVSIDGWIRIMNEHPQFDGIEFDYHEDAKGSTVAIESIIYRKDRAHPIKTIEYMEECRQPNSIPWQKVPRRFLRHRALIQGARIAFGFSGISADGDETVDGGELVTAPSLPSQKSLAEELGDEIPNYDKSEKVDETTGEVIDDAETEGIATDPATGMSEVDQATAQALDAGQTVQDIDGPLDDDVVDVEADFIGAKPDAGVVKQGNTWFNPDDQKLRYAHQTPNGIKWYLQPPEEKKPEAESQQSEQPEQAADDVPAWLGWVNGIKQGIADAKDKAALGKVEDAYLKQCASLPKEPAEEIEAMLTARRRELQG